MFIKTFITLNLILSFIELWFEIKELILDKQEDVPHEYTWWTFEYMCIGNVALFALAIIKWIWF